MGGIIGGNALDALFTAASDIAYRNGSIYHVMSDERHVSGETNATMPDHG